MEKENHSQSRSEKAVELFDNGLNCSQAVLLSFAEETGLDRNVILTIAAGFGAGMARQQLTCGAVTGAYMVLGRVLGSREGSLQEKKESIYAACQEFSRKFMNQKQSLSCRELLGYDMNTEEGRMQIDIQDLFTTVCNGCVKTAIEILEPLVCPPEKKQAGD